MTENKLCFVEAEEISVEQRKKNLRLRMKRRRSENENRDGKEERLVQNFLQLIEEDFAKKVGTGMRLTVFLYLSFSSEASTDKLINALIERGAILLAPRIDTDKMYAVLMGDDFSLSDRGIREPIGKIYEQEPDIVVLPLLAVDTHGNRLGYGGGYYDRYLKENKSARRIAYGYDFQVLEDVPHTANDERVDCIVTDKRVIVCNRNKTEDKE